jgi:CTP synthase
MRLGAQEGELAPDSRSSECYQSERISERHRHRYEFNNVFRSQFEANGMLFAGTSQNNSLVEIIEIPDHPWFVAVQYHPEFKSKPVAAHPLFAGFVGAAIATKETSGEHRAAR